MIDEDPLVVCGDVCENSLNNVSSIGSFIIKKFTEGGDRVATVSDFRINMSL